VVLLACQNGEGPTAEPRAPSDPEDRTPDGGSAGRDSGPGKVDSGPQANKPLTPGSALTAVAPSAAEQAAYSALVQKVDAVAKVDGAGLRAAYPTNFRSKLSYDPNSAEFIDRIQSSRLALTDGERGALGQNGFVISQRREFGTFLRGFAEIYSEHLPLYVTADALLESVHSSYDTILLQIEQRMLIPDLRALLQGMRTRLASSNADAATRADTDLYLSVALSLLDSKVVPPVAGASAEQVGRILTSARSAQGEEKLTLFQVERKEDFSQFVPRGHYSGDPTLEGYFRAMMWLGRVDFRLLETVQGKPLFRREQYLAMLLMHELVGSDLPRFERIDTTLRTFVGESDYMVLPQVAKLVADLGGPAAARAASDEAVAKAIVAGDYGKQQIASHIMDGSDSMAVPLNRSFALLGQRYIVDSHVFSEVVYDRLPQRRMMPTPLDAAFSALGNAQALAYHEELGKFSALPAALGRTRVLVDAHDETFWDANFYNLWLRALRALSPAADLSDPASVGLPEVAGTEAWGRRILNTQLGSWAELRHDTLLYAKQSYSGVPVCDYPDAYVDPYPEFYRALQKYAAAGSRIAELVADVDAAFSQPITDYFALLYKAVTLLGDMAERQRRGEPYEPAQLAFLNEAVRVERKSVGCTSIDVPDGWYARLFFQPDKSIVFDPTVADVHTQPADEAGNTVGKVLHVGTGYPRLMVTTVDTCMGPRAYVGVVYAYHEHTTKDYERLTDEKWAARFRQGGERPLDVPWLAPVLAK
jgi:hypothetical protein